MIIIGFLVFAVAVAAAIVAIVQNRTAMVHVNGLGYSWDVHVYWVLVAGLVIAAVGFLGLAMMRAGSVHAARLRRERRGLKRENARLNDAVGDRPVETAAPVAATPVVHTAPAAPAPAPAMAGGPYRDDVPAGYETAEPTDRTDPAPRHRGLFHRASHARVSND
jgi:hypothetical protein